MEKQISISLPLVGTIFYNIACGVVFNFNNNCMHPVQLGQRRVNAETICCNFVLDMEPYNGGRRDGLLISFTNTATLSVLITTTPVARALARALVKVGQ